MTVDWSEWITNVYAISPIGRAKLICLDYETNLLNFGPLEDNRNGELTFGKSYEVLFMYPLEVMQSGASIELVAPDYSKMQISILNDKGVVTEYRLDRFRPLSIFREEMLNKILN